MTATPCPLLAGLAKVQGELKPILKNQTVTVAGKTKDGTPFSYQFHYADLEAITDALRPLLAAEDLSLVQQGRFVEGVGWVLTTTIMHPATDRVLSGDTPILWGQDRDPKGYGGGQSYARRYGLCALLGIVSEDDDDGKRAQHDPEGAQKSRDGARRAANAGPAPQDRRSREGRGAPQGGPQEPPPGANQNAPVKPGKGLEKAIRSAHDAGFAAGAFMAEQAKVHGLLDDSGEPRQDLFDVVTADQAAAMLDALGKARTAARREAG